MKNVLTTFARKLRNEPTDAEKILWHELRSKSLGFKFRRQGIVGRYIIDFVCFEKKFVIEVDGGEHCESKQDCVRDAWLNSQGFEVMRFWNNDVLGNLDGVMEVIEEKLSSPSLTPAIRQATRERESVGDCNNYSQQG